MEQTTQFNFQGNETKPKKKGKIIIGIILAIILIAIIALVVMYFLVFSKPEMIFSKLIDNLNTVDMATFDTIKVDSEIKSSFEAEDESLNEQLQELNKFTISVGAQMDYQNQGEIVDLGLTYDDESVINGRLYYTNGTLYAYLEDIFDKYISVDLDEEQENELKELFDLTTIQNKKNNAKIALSIIGNELKEQIINNGTFEKNKVDMNLNGKNTSVTQFSLVLTEERLAIIIENICNNLANNEEFLNCFEESPKESLEELINVIEYNNVSNENEVRFSIYAQGLLYNVIGFGAEINIKDDEDSSISAVFLKESDELYTFNYTQGEKYINGKLDLKIEESSEEKQSGNAIITLEISDLGTMTLNMDYSYSYNQPVDEIDTDNSVKAEELTQTDLLGMMEKLMERPLIGDFMQGFMMQSSINNSFNNSELNNNIVNNNQITTGDNQLKINGNTVTYEVPSQLVFDSSLSMDSLKYYSTSDSSINATATVEWNNDEQTLINTIDSNYGLYENNTFYSNVQVSDLQTINIGNNTFKYKSLSYETSLGEICQAITLWYSLDNEYIYKVDIQSNGTTITNDMIMPFLNINVQ